MISDIYKSIMFYFKNRKLIGELTKEGREIQESVKDAVKATSPGGKKITKSELHDIFLNVDDVINKLVELTEDEKIDN